jgi:hypothetical protein
MFRSWHKRLSWWHGYRQGKAGGEWDRPWWAREDAHATAYVDGKRSSFKPHPKHVHIPRLEIEASTDPSDYEIENSPHWPPPLPPPPPKLSPEQEAERARQLRGVAYLIVLPCWVFHKNDADPWPSRLHGHHNERPLKLDAVTGLIYSIKTREHVQTLRPRELMRIQVALINSKDFADRARVLIGSV